MNGWNYVIAGYAFVFIGLAFYIGYVMWRGRSLAKQVPVERRRFLE